METKYGISRIFSPAARNTAQAPTVECPKCQETYVLGVNGISTGCDQCEGVTRDAGGFAWVGEILNVPEKEVSDVAGI